MDIPLDPRLLTDIDGGEGCRLTAYQDSLGYWTIGWGHKLPEGVDWSGHTITQARADSIRDADVEIAAHYAARLLEWSYLDTDARRNALIELCFEMGSRWLAFHNTRAAILRHDWKAVHDGLLDSLWARQVHGTRATRIANYMLTGVYPCSAS